MHIYELVNLKAAQSLQYAGLFNIVAVNQMFAYFP